MKNILSLFLLAGILYGADLSRDSDGIVTDISTNLEWQDDVSSVEKSWSDAIEYCEGLSIGGHDDWRLANINELLSIIDYSKNTPAIKESIFQNITSNADYWSSSSHHKTSSSAWIVYFGSGNTNAYPKSDSKSVRCVRSIQ